MITRCQIKSTSKTDANNSKRLTKCCTCLVGGPFMYIFLCQYIWIASVRSFGWVLCPSRVALCVSRSARKSGTRTQTYIHAQSVDPSMVYKTCLVGRHRIKPEQTLALCRSIVNLGVWWKTAGSHPANPLPPFACANTHIYILVHYIHVLYMYVYVLGASGIL